MFKLPDLPSAEAECHELTDFAELLAWDKGLVSAREIAAYLGRLGENDHNVGCDDNDDENADEMDEVMVEIGRRSVACGGGYPFVLEREGTVLRHAPSNEDHRTHLYHYLLLSTRLNMTSDRVHARIDGADLLEEISAETLRCYLGAQRARTMVFGTATPGKFKDKINHLCRALGEGGAFRTLDTGSVDANDDKLDTVSWLPFADKSRSQLIVFGQCKTGTNWRDMLTQLQPTDFIKRWMSEPYLHDPLRAFCVAEAVHRSRWVGYSVYSGLLFDRCRIVDFCEKPGSVLLGKIKKWSAAAKATIGFKGRIAQRFIAGSSGCPKTSPGWDGRTQGLRSFTRPEPIRVCIDNVFRQVPTSDAPPAERRPFCPIILGPAAAARQPRCTAARLSAPVSIPTGLHPSAQGWRAATTLGPAHPIRSNPARVAALSRPNRCNSVGVDAYLEKHSLGSSCLATLG